MNPITAIIDTVGLLALLVAIGAYITLCLKE